MYVTKSKYYQHQESFWRINSTTSGCYTPMLKTMLDQFFNLHTYYARAFVLRFDLRQASYTDSNQRMTQFFRRLSKQLKAKYKLKRLAYFWVREKDRSQAQHYHCVLFVDGRMVNYSTNISSLCEAIWTDMSGAYWRPENCFYLSHRDDEAVQQKVIWRISYLAKTRTKADKPPQTKSYGSSRISPNPKSLIR
ncbi:YagK/YfjJ domain-containing protein [Shewanella sp. MF05960]|uniref:YagK/YfjJ domain-containing protein n=1 Tax=Shewanella sp. MF05960 TaxID=3434874 RepID=UPI003D79978C